MLINININININFNFSSLNLQDHCAFIVGHTSTTGRHVSLSFDFLLSLLYLLRSTNSVQFQVHNSLTAFHTYIGYVFPLWVLLLRKCGTCSSQMIHSTQVYCSIHSVPGCQHFQTQQTPDTQTHSPGIWSLCSISYGSAFVNRKELASCDESAALITVELIFWQLFYMMRKLGQNTSMYRMWLVEQTSWRGWWDWWDIFKLVVVVVVWCFDSQLLYCLDQPWKKIQNKTQKYCVKTSATVTCDSWRKEQ